jgi:mono/diheme cytochrome c family protein/cytochrome c553
MRRCLTFVLVLSTVPAFSATADKAEEFFEMKVRPILAKNCFACHTASKMGGLEMSSREALLKGGADGAAIVPGDPDHSLLIRAVRHEDARIKMPPQGQLSSDEIDQLSLWVKAGAVWPKSHASQGTTAAKGDDYVITPEQRNYWAFRPVTKPAPPKADAWAKTPIDHFIAAKLQEKGLAPVKPADKRTLIRRATFDLTGLPPTPEEVDSFLKDKSAGAFAKVVDRLLASPRYGERWGRHWLDVSRYSDDKLDSERDAPHPNAFRYRDWVIQAFNDDMAYDEFVKAQIAGDLLPNPEKTAAGLGLYALSPEFQDDRVDVTTRGFLGLTVACATCHNHKFDPIPQKDYYALLSVFDNTKMDEYPLAPKAEVEEYKARKKKVEDEEKKLKEYVDAQAAQLADIFATRTSDYLMAAAKLIPAESVDKETLERWNKYLAKTEKEHPFLKPWYALQKDKQHESEARKLADDFQARVVKVFAEHNRIERENMIRLGGSTERGNLSRADLLSLPRDDYFLWRDLFSDKGILVYDEKGINRFLTGEFKTYLVTLRKNLDQYKKEIPPQYPFLQIISDVAKPKKQHVYLRGDKNNPGDEVDAHFLSILSSGKPKPYTHGSGRLELAEDIADPKNPLTPRVIVNRVWQWHFGVGIARTASNFGELGERPVNPELLDYLAARLLEDKWSIKALQREIMLSATYQLGSDDSQKAETVDPEDRLMWRFNRQRLDAEEVRDAVLFASGKLDLQGGGKPEHLDDSNFKRTVYGFVSRRRLDPMLELFDFPNANSTSEARIVTNVPLQGLFFLNSPLLMSQSEALAARVESSDEKQAIEKAYRLLFDRAPTQKELKLGLEFLHATPEKPWPKYLQVLLSSNEFNYVS